MDSSLARTVQHFMIDSNAALRQALAGISRRLPRRSPAGITVAVSLLALCGTLLGGCSTSQPTVQAPATNGAPGPATFQSGGQGEAGVNTAAPPTGRKPSVRIAMLLPLSGNSDTAAVAKGLKQAGELALFEINNPGFQLVVKDTAGTPEGAKAAAEDAAREGAELIVGPLFAKSVEAVAPIARAANIPVVAFSNDRRTAGGGVYLLSFLVGEEVDRIVGYAVRQGKRRFAALVPDDAYGQLADQAFRIAVQRHGGTIVATEKFPTSANAMVEPTQRLFDVVKTSAEAGTPIDAIFIPGSSETLPRLGPLITYAKLDTQKVKLLGTGGWDYPNVGRDPAFVGAWYPAPDPRGWQAFSERFAKAFGAAPPRIASFAYDSVTIAASLAAVAPKGTRFTPMALTQSRGFSGVDGPVRFLSSGMAERGLAIVEVKEFAGTVVEPAPQTFPTPSSPTASLQTTSAPAPR